MNPKKNDKNWQDFSWSWYYMINENFYLNEANEEYESTKKIIKLSNINL